MKTDKEVFEALNKAFPDLIEDVHSGVGYFGSDNPTAYFEVTVKDEKVADFQVYRQVKRDMSRMLRDEEFSDDLSALVRVLPKEEMARIEREEAEMEKIDREEMEGRA